MNTTTSVEAEWTAIAPNKVVVAIAIKTWLESPWRDKFSFRGNREQ